MGSEAVFASSETEEDECIFGTFDIVVVAFFWMDINFMICSRPQHPTTKRTKKDGKRGDKHKHTLGSTHALFNFLEVVNPTAAWGSKTNKTVSGPCLF